MGQSFLVFLSNVKVKDNKLKRKKIYFKEL